MTGHRTKVLANALWLPAIAVGVLQMYRVDAGALTNYGADFFGPIALYASFRTNGTIMRRFTKEAPSPAASALLVLAGCVLWEVCQLFDFSGTPLGITAGRFDPGDLAAYVLGVALPYAVEMTVLHRRTLPVRSLETASVESFGSESNGSP